LLLAVIAVIARFAMLDYVEFKGDEATIAGGVRDMVEGHVLLQVGTMLSGGILDPPLFHYLLIPALALTTDARVATGAVALANVVAVLITYALGRRLWDIRAGLLSAGLFAIAPWAVVYSRKIWQSEMEPLFAAVCLYAIVRARQGGRWWVGVAIAAMLGMCQLHPTGLLLAPVLLLAGPRFWRMARPIPVLLGLGLGLAPAVPYIDYDTTHGWPNLLGFLAAARQKPMTDLTSLYFSFSNLTSFRAHELEGVPDFRFTPWPDILNVLSIVAAVLVVVTTVAVVVWCCMAVRVRENDDLRRRAGDVLLVLVWAWLPVLVTLRHSTSLNRQYFLVVFPAPFVAMSIGAALLLGWSAMPALGPRRGDDGLAHGQADVGGILPELPQGVKRWLAAPTLALLALVVAGWAFELISFYHYLPTGPISENYGLPLKITAGIADIARRSAPDGRMFQVADNDVSPALGYLLRDVPDRQNLPANAIVLPPKGKAAGYVIDDARLVAVRTLRDSGAREIGIVDYPDRSRQAIALTWPADLDPSTLSAGLTRLPVRLTNGVHFLGYLMPTDATTTISIQYVWTLDQDVADVRGADLALYTHIVDKSGKSLAAKDDMPYPSVLWRVGETISVWYDIPLSDVPPGSYEVRSGIYARPSIQRVSAIDSSGKTVDGEFSLGMIRVQH
jgi:4-amino-4-deoxy-L-arabinose transferase-like glycosyltransferase